jgi:hypothetical protein
MYLTYDVREGWRMENRSNSFLENYNSNCIYPDSTFISSLEIADGLKETANKIQIYIRRIIKYAIFRAG